MNLFLKKEWALPGKSPAFELTITQAALALKLSGTRIRHLIRDGRIKAKKIGPIWLLDAKSVKSYRPRPQGRAGHF